MESPNPQIKYVILDNRISSGYYTYKLELYQYNGEWRYIDEEPYGDMGYWGMSNETRNYHDALKELLERNNLTRGDIAAVEPCGAFQRSCHEVLEELEKHLN